jgi:hypothetical protein
MDYFHLHCLIPAGALSFDEKTWRQALEKFLFKKSLSPRPLSADTLKTHLPV